MISSHGWCRYREIRNCLPGFPDALEPEISHLSFKEAKERMLRRFYSRFIRNLLEKSDGNVSRAAETAGIQRQYLHRLMKDAGIDAGDYKTDR